MRTTLAAATIMVLCVLTILAGPASAGPDNRCYGEVASGIASTWPWAHDGQVDFPPPPGGLALWVQEFGPDVGVTSVRELQLLFCSA